MKWRFLGTKGFTESGSEKHKYHSCSFVSRGGSGFFVDAGEQIPEEVKEAIVNNGVVVLSHAHPDHAFALKDKKLQSVTVFAHPRVLQDVAFFSGPKKKLPAQIGPFTVEAFPIRHSSAVFSTALVISDGEQTVFYSPDFLGFKRGAKEALSSSDVWIADGSTLNKPIIHGNNGHASIKQILEIAREVGVGTVVFTHFGKKTLAFSRNDVQVPEGINCLVATDGSEFDFGNDDSIATSFTFGHFLSHPMGSARFIKKVVSLLIERIEGRRYIEPFAGSARAFFALRELGWDGPAIINDKDPIWYLSYMAIKDKDLKALRAAFEYVKSKEKPTIDWSQTPKSRAEALRFPLLVRVSYWGLGTGVKKENVEALDWEDVKRMFLHDADLMKNVTILNTDGMKLMKKYGASDSNIWYIDPPWRKADSPYFKRTPEFDWEEFLRVVENIKGPVVMCMGTSEVGGITNKRLERSFYPHHLERRSGAKAQKVAPRLQSLWTNWKTKVDARRLSSFSFSSFDIKSYDPSKHSPQEVREKWRLAVAWYATKKRGGNLKFSEDEIKDFAWRVFQSLVEDGDVTFHPDGAELDLLREILREHVKSAMYLPAPHPEMLSTGKKTAVVKSRIYNKMTDEFLAVCDRNFCWGFARFLPPEEISLKEFEQRKKEHQVSSDERRAWWPESNRLYLYKVREFIPLEKPERVRLPKGAQTFVNLRGMLSLFYSSTLASLDVQRASNVELLVLHARAHSAYFVDEEKAIELHSKVVEEMGKRGLEHRYTTELDAKVWDSEFVKLDEVIEALPDKLVVFPDKVQLVGSLVSSGFGHDVDLLERGDSDHRFVFRLSKVLPPHIRRKLHWLVGEGGYSQRITVYDIAYIKRTELAVAASRFRHEETEAMAKESRRLDEVKPFRFFAMQKTKAGYHKREYFSVDEAKMMLSIAPFPWDADIKADGMNVQIHKVGRRVKIYSEDGSVVNINQIKDLAARLRDMKDNFVACAELEIWLSADVAKRKGFAQETQRRGDYFHLGRSTTSGYVHSKTYDEDLSKGVVLNVYDLLWLNGKDIHNQELKDRIEARDKVFKEVAGPGVMVGHIQYWVLNSPEDLPRLWKKVKSEGYVEGLMLKPLTGQKSKYVLWPDGGYWIKLKSLYELTGEIIEVKQEISHKTGKPLPAWRYLVAIKDEEGNYTPLGWTYAVKNHFKVGDKIEVRFQNLNKYVDPETGKVWFNWWRPTVVSEQPETKDIDPISVAEKMVVASKGEVKERKLPKEYKQALAKLGVSASFIELCDDAESEILHFCLDFSASRLNPERLHLPPDKEKFIKRWQLSQDEIEKTDLEDFPENFFVMQLHFRGKTVHIDYRRKTDHRLEGLTILNQVKGAIKDDVDTIEEAKRFGQRLLNCDASVSKFHPCMKPSDSCQCVFKAHQPLDWLKEVEDIRQPGEIGATRFKEGVFWLIDSGIAKPGMKRPWARDFYIYGKHFKGRMVIRALRTEEKYEKAGLQPVFWIVRFADPTTPPYIFSLEQRRKRDYVPTDSTLPYELEAVIPKELRWWEAPLSREERLRRIDAAYNYLIDKGILSGRKLELSLLVAPFTKESLEGRFVLHRLWWRGNIVVRGMPVIHWRLRWERGNKCYQAVFVGDNPITSENAISAVVEPLTYPPPNGESPNDWFTFSGTLPPKHPENPLKKLNVNVDIVDKGSIKIVEDTDMFKSFHIDGQRLKGYYILKREQPGEEFWMFQRSKKPGEHI